MFEPKKFNEVFEDMRGRTSVITDFEVGSVARTMYESFAFEIALLYEKMRLVYLAGYVDTAQGQQLDMVVSVLGIKRSLPDFAAGVVTFERDVGNQDIEIPLGALVATEDTPELPKKVYQTIEPKTLPKDHTSVEVKVQAVNRGEEETTPAETIVVMPRPIAGIKAVVNREATRFTGKRRETDDELRERAKNALISSGKATIIAIENALLGLAGVKDVKIKENFHFARGQVILERLSGSAEIIVPKGSHLTAEAVKTFETTELVILADGAASIPVTVQSLLEGQAGEVAATATWTIEGNAGLETLSAGNAEAILLGNFGIIEIFVDGVDLNDPTAKKRLEDEIERVRAAGIFVLLKSAISVNVAGVFRIEIRPDLKLSPEERAKFEARVKTELEKYISERKMGQPLLFSQIVKNTLSLDGIENLEDFTLSTRKEQAGKVKRLDFDASAKRIEIEEFEKFNPQYICVASETKPLPIHIQFKANNLDKTKREAVNTALAGYFGGLKAGEPIQKSQIQSKIEAITTIVAPTLQLSPEHWCDCPPSEAAEVEVSFVEQAKLGDVFAYSKFLKISGALKLSLPVTITEAQKQQVNAKIKEKIQNYLDSLKSEADVVLADLIALAAAVDPVLTVDLEPADFRVMADEVEVIGRVSAQKIEVQEFEKAQLQYFCISGDVQKVTIQVTALALKLLVSDPPPAGFDQAATISAIQLAVKNAVNNFLVGATAGQNVVYANLKNAIQNLVAGANYNVPSLALTATSACDGRVQQTDINTARDIHVRSVEVAVMEAIAANQITVTVQKI